MDQTPIVQLPTPPIEQKKKRNSFLFLEIGLFEVGFVVILLALIFGVLNYFNIINLSKPFPFLSVLPTKRLTREEQMQLSLETFIKSTLNAQYVPDFHQTTFTKSSSSSISTIKVSWEKTNNPFTATIYYNKGVNSISEISLQFTTHASSTFDTLDLQKDYATYFTGFSIKDNDIGCSIVKNGNSIMCISPTYGNKNGNMSYQSIFSSSPATFSLEACKKFGQNLTKPGCPIH